MYKSHHKGFTGLEILIVAGIIAALGGGGVVAYNAVQNAAIILDLKLIGQFQDKQIELAVDLQNVNESLTEAVNAVTAVNDAIAASAPANEVASLAQATVASVKNAVEQIDNIQKATSDIATISSNGAGPMAEKTDRVLDQNKEVARIVAKSLVLQVQRLMPVVKTAENALSSERISELKTAILEFSSIVLATKEATNEAVARVKENITWLETKITKEIKKQTERANATSAVLADLQLAADRAREGLQSKESALIAIIEFKQKIADQVQKGAALPPSQETAEAISLALIMEDYEAVVVAYKTENENRVNELNRLAESVSVRAEEKETQDGTELVFITLAPVKEELLKAITFIIYKFSDIEENLKNFFVATNERVAVASSLLLEAKDSSGNTFIRGEINEQVVAQGAPRPVKVRADKNVSDAVDSKCVQGCNVSVTALGAVGFLPNENLPPP